MSSRRPSRRVPSKARGLRSAAQPLPDSDAGGKDEAVRIELGTRAANRAAKRALGGVRPKVAARGRSGGRPARRSNTGLIALAIGALVIGAGVILLGNPFGTPTPIPTTTPTQAAVVGDGTCPVSQPAALPAGETRLVTIRTGLGDIVIRVDGALSPIAAGNFVALATCHFYDRSPFHRTAALQDGTPFVIQGGSPAGGGQLGYSIDDETVTAKYKRGTVAMARTDQAHSQTSQFFIVLDDKAEPPLVSANTYAIFGEVVTGMDVADAIFAASAGTELPTNPIQMLGMTVAAAPAPTATPGASVTPSAAPSQASTAPAASTAATTAP